jgi:hypothetical protein
VEDEHDVLMLQIIDRPISIAIVAVTQLPHTVLERLCKVLGALGCYVILDKAEFVTELIDDLLRHIQEILVGGSQEIDSLIVHLDVAP